jgi:tRNA(Ile)-lysidine synthase
MNHTHDSLLNTVRAAIMRDALLEAGERVIVAVSGGADSTALLHLLTALEYRVEAAHFDHHTRCGESARDAEFVRDTAAKLGLTFHSGGTHAAVEAREARRSFEEYARAARYAFLRRVAKETGCGALALGHHRDDQAETVLLRLLRGTAGRGLAGMLPVRTEGSLRIIRPLLDCTHAELCTWLLERGIPWREDASNADPGHARRNRVRHELLPALARDYNPRIHDALARLATTQRLENALLEGLLEQECARLGLATGTREQVPVAAVLSMHPALRRRWWVGQLAALGARLDAEHMDAAETFLMTADTGARLDLGYGLFLYRGRDVLLFVTAQATESGETVLAVPGETAALDRIFCVTLKSAATLPQGGVRAWCGPSRQVFDAARVPGVLRVRARRPGDRFHPLGMIGTRKLQDYFVDRGVPEPLRDKVPLVTADDMVLWIVGHAPSADAAVTEDTEQLLQVEVRHAGE